MAGSDPIPDKKDPVIKTFTCPSCGGGVSLWAPGQTVSVACQSCGTTIDATNENYQIIQKYNEALKIKPVIPLGTRGRLRGHLWAVIGFMRRTDGTGVYFWDEYLLFNPARGYRWLTECDGHWNFVISTHEKPKNLPKKWRQGSRVHLFNKVYTLFHKGEARVSYVLGEFYWRVKVGDTVKVMDFILPPEILSCEEDSTESIWSVGEYIEAQVVKEAFNIQGVLPYKKGTAPNQPTNFPYAKSVAKLWFTFLILLTVIQMITMITTSSEQVYKNNFPFTVTQNSPEKVKVTESFALKPKLFSDSASVEFELYADINNAWLEVAYSLVNNITGETIDLNQGIEYYSGVDADGSWTEGSKHNSHIISAVPAGNYHLNIEASGPPQLSIQEYRVIVSRDVPLWSNWIGAVILISVFPLFVWWRKRAFEVSRWSTSDYSPYDTED